MSIEKSPKSLLISLAPLIMGAVFLLIILTGTYLGPFVMGFRDADDATQVVICICIVFCALIYFWLNQSPLKILFGLAQIVLGIWIDWATVSKMELSNSARGERLAFLAAAFAAIAHGAKDIQSGIRLLKEPIKDDE